MLWGEPQICYGIFVTCGRITGIAFPAISGIAARQISHDPVACDLGYDRGSRDGKRTRVTLYYRMRRTWQVRGQTISVNQQVVGWYVQRGYGTPHRKETGLQDVQFVDLGGARMADPDIGPSEDLGIEGFPHGTAQTLGIMHTIRQVVGVEPDRRRCHRSRQRTAPDLIHTDNAVKSTGKKLSFKMVIGGGHVHWHMSQKNAGRGKARPVQKGFCFSAG